MFEGLFEPAHAIIILVIALILFGPGKLPDLGAALGRGIREFRSGMQETFDSSTGSTPVESGGRSLATLACSCCGAVLPSGAHFCGQCGAPTTPEA